MSNVRNARRELASINNGDGLVSVQQPDGSFKHISREEWEGAYNGEPEE